MRWNADERRGAVSAIAVGRVAAVPAFLAVCVRQPGVRTAPLLLLVVGAFLFACLGAVLLLGNGWQRAPLPVMLAVDAVFIAGFIAVSGGGGSDARFVGPLVLVSVAIALPRSLSIWHSAWLTAVCAIPVLAMSVDEEPVVSFFAVSGLAAVLAYTIAAAAEAGTRQLQDLAAERRELLAAALTFEQDTRRELAQDVHDRALQTMLAARQDLVEAAEAGDSKPLALARAELDSAIGAVRDAVHELHAGALTGPLPQSLHALMGRISARHGVEAEAVVDGTGGEHSEMLWAVARQLVADALDRRDVTRMQVSLRDGSDGGTVLVVRDDGRASSMRGEATGLAVATSTERVVHAGGELEVERRIGSTTVTVRMRG